ncbi:hypothetical protein [Dyadobacter frigoris]|uniref:hypothetical protein n=1 Tax=Dyadobacter frigoris TaxID=2576211 RepID=UPI001485362E|nr:hypothetical protein [Dyadobacter frigoris]GLU52048.1 hypothetical protein Dfri01_15090 [Dyadobacter frigoris]
MTIGGKVCQLGTFDEIKGITHLTGTSTLATAQVSKIVATNTDPAIMVYEPANKTFAL